MLGGLVLGLLYCCHLLRFLLKEFCLGQWNRRCTLRRRLVLFGFVLQILRLVRLSLILFVVLLVLVDLRESYLIALEVVLLLVLLVRPLLA